MNWFKRNYKTIIRISYIIPILVAAGISIYHVISWYDITNPISWAIYLSVGVEVAALSALAGMTAKMNKWVYLPFVIVTFIQVLGNIFASYSYIDVNGELFKSWVELFDPIFNSFGWVENGDIMAHKRILGILGGIFIPIISLSFLHLLISFNDKVEKESSENPKPIESNGEVSEELSGKVSDANKELLEGLNDATKDGCIPAEEEKRKDVEEQPPVNTDTDKIMAKITDKNKKFYTVEDVKELNKKEVVLDNRLDIEFPEEELPEENLIEQQPEVQSELVKGETKRQPVIPTGKVEREEISEIKDRGFSVKIPKSKTNKLHLIQKVGKKVN